MKFFEVFSCNSSNKKMLENIEILNIDLYKNEKKAVISIKSQHFLSKAIKEYIVRLLKTDVFLNGIQIIELKEYYDGMNLKKEQIAATAKVYFLEESIHLKSLNILIKNMNFVYIDDYLIIKGISSIYLDDLVNIARKVENMFLEKYNIEIHIKFDETEVQEEKITKRYVYEKPKPQMKEVVVNKVRETLYGKNYSNDVVVNIKDIDINEQNIVIRGLIVNSTVNETKTGKIHLKLSIFDNTDTITCIAFIKKEDYEQIKDDIKGDIEIFGNSRIDEYEKDLILDIRGMKKIELKKEEFLDLEEEKRIELHAQTKASEMSSTMEISKYIKRAKEYGHEAVAITDKGVVQGFPVTNYEKDIKVIYGLNAYVVNDKEPFIRNIDNYSFDDTFVVLDIETTGLFPRKDKLIEIACVKINNGEIIDEYTTFINPEVDISYKITEITKITNDMVRNEPVISDVIKNIVDFLGDYPVVAHNARFDASFLMKIYDDFGYKFNNPIIDTLLISRILYPDLKAYRLDRICRHLNVELVSHHRAIYDTRATAECFIIMLKDLKEKYIDFKDANNYVMEPNVIKKIRPFNLTLLCKNQKGLKDLYKLVSISHLKYVRKFGKSTPIIPLSVLDKYRENLLVGSGVASNLYESYFYGYGDCYKKEAIEMCDYVEIVGPNNNKNLLKDEPLEENELIKINLDIVDVSKLNNKIVVAVGDLYMLNKGEEVYRHILEFSSKQKNQRDNYDFSSEDDSYKYNYYMNTKEMLLVHSYLGDDLRDIVIYNTHKINNLIEKVKPINPDKCPPEIENSDKDLREMCYKKAYSIYGENLPKMVEERLEKELQSIISNGFAVMYIIAHKLVKNSLDAGYLVGSRGSVGSSFVATMSSITEVNPLPAHYYCKECKYSDFDSDYVKSFSGNSGADMEDKLCPKCNIKLKKEGHDIPFETFLGFKGDKEPDIDLNFSGEYQARAHKNTEEIFGEGYTFRAGTIGTVADKTAFSAVKEYYEKKNEPKKKAELVRQSEYLKDCKKSTGQHPGGIIVLPHGREIEEFTPVQYPSDNDELGIITTHFDYHSIDSNLLKLDILGHDDPTMVKMLEDITGFSAENIEFDDQDVLSLFTGVEKLNFKEDVSNKITIGSLGVPEFGTNFVINMLKDTKPTKFSELIRISGLSHGTDVWLGNAQELIQNKICELSSAICTRDDIMTFLIYSGIESGKAFSIMENVRKGKGLTSEDEELMRNTGIPEWYIDSCNKIKYMFPKAHAVAYVMMAFRIAYYKINYPLAYYAAYFSIRAKAFDYEIMCISKEKAISYLTQYENTPNLSKKEEDVLSDLKLVNEMYLRGYSFLPISLLKSDASKFIIEGDKLIPPFSAIDGLGEKAAQKIIEEREKGEFISIQDLTKRAGINKTTLDKMKNIGILDNLQESNQASFFDMF